MSKASDWRYGRRGGGWASPPQTDADAASIDAWRRQRDALEAASGRAGEQLELFEGAAEDQG